MWEVTVKDNRSEVNNSLFDCVFYLLFSICVLVPKEFSTVVAVASVIFYFTLSSRSQGISGGVNRLLKSHISWSYIRQRKPNGRIITSEKYCYKKNGQHCYYSNANLYFLQMGLFILCLFCFFSTTWKLSTKEVKFSGSLI